MALVHDTLSDGALHMCVGLSKRFKWFWSNRADTTCDGQKDR